MRPYRYLPLLGHRLRASALLSFQYRTDFFAEGIISLFWAVAAVVPLRIMYLGRETVAGWRFEEALLVVACFVLLQGVLEGAINPSLAAVVEHVRKGTLDFLLLKPADSQFLISTSRFQLWRMSHLVVAGALAGWALAQLGVTPTAWALAQTVVLLGCAVVVLSALLPLTASLAFFVPRMDSTTVLLTAVFDAARWPSAVFKGALHIAFTFVIPLGVMTTYPAEALLGRLPLATLAGSIIGSGLFLLTARWIWQLSLRHYKSAGG